MKYVTFSDFIFDFMYDKNQKKHGRYMTQIIHLFFKEHLIECI